MYGNSEVATIGKVDFRNSETVFGIYTKDRLQHIYVCGKTGCGKSSLLQTIVISDIENNRGCAIFDNHGDTINTLLDYVPEQRVKDCIYFCPSDIETTVSFNPLMGVPRELQFLAASGLISIFRNIFFESWGVRMEHIWRYAVLTLLEYGNGTLLDIQPLLTDALFRENILHYISSHHIRAFWRNEFDKYTPAFRSEAISPILNKIDLFVASEPLRNTVGQKSQGLNFREIIDTGKIFFADLSKGRLGQDASSLLGSMLINSFQLAALSRFDQQQEERRPYFLMVDECQNYLTKAIIEVMSESRKFGLGLFLANQYISQLDEEIREAVLGNCGTIISFAVGSTDAELLEKEFYPVFAANDLLQLPKYSIYLRLCIEGMSSKPFSAKTLPLRPLLRSYKNEILSNKPIYPCSNSTTLSKNEVRSLGEQGLFWP